MYLKRPGLVFRGSQKEQTISLLIRHQRDRGGQLLDNDNRSFSSSAERVLKLIFILLLLVVVSVVSV